MDWNNHIVSESGRICFMAHSGTDDNSKLEAAAHLIAAAPALYEALKAAERLLDESEKAFEEEFGNINPWQELPDGELIVAGLASARGESE